MIKLLKKVPFFLLLLAIFFCLHGSVENYGYLYAAEVLQVGGIILLCMAAAVLVAWLFTKNFSFASLLVCFISLWYLFFGALHDVIKANRFLHFIRSYAILLPVLLLVTVAVAWWLRKNGKLYPKLFLYLNLLFFIFCISDVVLLLYKKAGFKEPQPAVTHRFDTTKATSKPNVYFLLFDEYAGYKSLHDSFGFRNDSLYHFMQQQGFLQLPVFSNYDFTPYSMSSIFNMQYVPGSSNNQRLLQSDIQQRFGEMRHAQVPAIFQSLGYRMVNLSMFDLEDNPALAQTNGLFPIHTALLTNKIFHRRLLKDIGWWFVTGRFSLSFLNKKLLYKDDAYNQLVEAKLLEQAGSGRAQPQFCYAHFFLPHSQYCRDSTGALNAPEKVSDLSNKSLYLAYLQYSNRVMQRLVNKITTADPQAIVLVMSDHGFYDYLSPGDYDPLNFDNICWIRLPAAMPAQSLPRSNVNVFPYLFNSAYGQQMPYLPDSTVYVIENAAVQ